MSKFYLLLPLSILILTLSCKSMQENTIVVSWHPTMYTPLLLHPPQPKKEMLIEDKNLNNDTQSNILSADRGDILITPKRVMFDINQYSLNETSIEGLNYVAAFMLTNEGISIIVEGHTDLTGTVLYNTKLSKQRAEGGIAHLSRDKTFDTNRLIEQSLASKLPISDKLEENRRLEFIIIRNQFELDRYNKFITSLE